MSKAGMLFIILFSCVLAQASQVYDVVVYGGSSAGVIAAVQAARMGNSVILVSPEEHLGGLTSNGLGWTDTGDQSAIGGVSREFYQRIHKYYQNPAAWKYEKPHELNQNIGHGRFNPNADALWVFEPHVAEIIFEEMLKEAGVPVVRDAWLDRENGVKKENNRIQSITTLDQRTYQGRMFIDATYVGDLMAAAGVSFTTGREPNSQYNEQYNGVQKGARHHGHYFTHNVDPYVVPGDPSSGVLPRVHADDPGEDGDGDHRIQAYCFRISITKVPENRVEWVKPENYDPLQYEILIRNYEAGDMRIPLKNDMMPNKKTDTNNNYAFSSDNIGMNYNYPEGSYEEREEIYNEHINYQLGLMWTLANNPRIPKKIRDEVSEWGLAKDEYTDNNHMPYKLYIREARRMIGQYVMTEHDCVRTVDTPKPVGLGSYTMDSHNVQRYITPEGFVQNEGDIGVGTGGPYEISYESLIPKKDECENLLVPVCISSTHIAYGSIRMEPVFMLLGQSTATAAVHAIRDDVAVQDVDYAALKERLLKDKQIIETDAPPKTRPIRTSNLPGVTVDNRDAELHGNWLSSRSIGPYVEDGYLHDGNEDKGKTYAVFSTELKDGVYEVRLSYSANENRASNVPVVVHYAGGTETVKINQRKKPEHENAFATVGKFKFSATKPAKVEINTTGTDGHVIIDAVQWIPIQ